MKAFISLICFCLYIQVSQADDFKIDFTKELIDAAEEQQNQSALSAIPSQATNGSQIRSGQEQSDSNDTQLKTSAQNKDTEDEQVVKAKVDEKDKKAGVEQTKIQSVKANQYLQSILHQDSLGQFGVDPTLGFYLTRRNVQTQPGIDLLENIQEDLHLLLGEEAYAKMIWLYKDLKKFDNWINLVMADYELYAPHNSLGAARINGLNDQLNADVFLRGSLTTDRGSDPQHAFYESRAGLAHHVAADLTLNNATTQMDVNFENESKFFFILKYLTVVNFIYLIVTLLVILYLGKLFKLLVRQKG